MISALLLGLLLGMRHAMESDHVAAVATLTANSPSLQRSLLLGAVWGLGHTATLLAVCTAVLLADAAIPTQVAHVLEGAVGVMLLALGIDLLRRLRRARIHVHAHTHTGASLHLHVHSHRGDAQPHAIVHRHEHPRGFPVRALAIGMMHGMAGSAALMVVAFAHFASTLSGLAYVAVFGAGSIAGMALLSLAIAVPLRWSSKSFGWLHHLLQGAAALCAIGIGAALVAEQAVLLV